MPNIWIQLIIKYWKQLLLIGIIPFVILLLLILYPFFIVADATDKTKGFFASLVRPFTYEGRYYIEFDKIQDKIRNESYANHADEHYRITCPLETNYSLIIATLQYPMMILDSDIYEKIENEDKEDDEDKIESKCSEDSEPLKCLEEEDKDKLKEYYRFALKKAPLGTVKFGLDDKPHYYIHIPILSPTTNIGALARMQFREEERQEEITEENDEGEEVTRIIIIHEWFDDSDTDYQIYKDYLKEIFIPYYYKYYGFKSEKEALEDTEELEYIIDNIIDIAKNIKSAIEEEYPSKCASGNVYAGGVNPFGNNYCGVSQGWIDQYTTIPFPGDNWGSVKVNSPFGPRNGTLHRGIDLVTHLPNQVVTATAEGLVLKVVDNYCRTDSSGSSYGSYILIESVTPTGVKYTHRYAHLKCNTSEVREGQSVIQGQALGIMGSSGHSTGIHLHYEINMIIPLSSPLPVDPIGSLCGMLPIFNLDSDIIVRVSNEDYTLEQYLMGVIASELGTEGIPYEALKAQVIAARTYLVNHIKPTIGVKNGKDVLLFDVPNSTSFQTFNIKKFNQSTKVSWQNTIIQAVSDTSRFIMVKNGNSIGANYSACPRGEINKVPSSSNKIDSLCSEQMYINALVLLTSGLYIPPYNANLHSKSLSYGMSQYGAVYAALANKWDYLDILNYYYNFDSLEELTVLNYK